MFAKIFRSLWEGSMRGLPDVQLVWIFLLAHADRDGVVDVHPRAIAEATGLSAERVRTALETLESPDDESRSEAERGRRITRLDDHRDWGWIIVNYEYYRNLRDAETQRQATARRVRIHRLRKAGHDIPHGGLACSPACPHRATGTCL